MIIEPLRSKLDAFIPQAVGLLREIVLYPGAHDLAYAQMLLGLDDNDEPVVEVQAACPHCHPDHDQELAAAERDANHERENAAAERERSSSNGRTRRGRRGGRNRGPAPKQASHRG